MRVAARLLLTAMLGATAALAQEGPLAISGQVLGAAGDGLADVELLLAPIPDPFDRALLDLAGDPLPPPVARSSTDETGRFRIDAPEPGFWRLVARRPGRAAMELAFRREPLLEATTLLPVELAAAATFEVTVLDASGAPAAGARVVTATVKPAPRRSGAADWSPHTPAVFTDADGRVELALPRGTQCQIQAWRSDHRPSITTPATGRSTTLRLRSAVARRLLVTDAAGPVAGAAIRLGEIGWPATRTDEEGAATIHGDVGGVAVTVVLLDGRSAQVRLEGDEGVTDAPFALRIAASRRLGGRVVDSVGRRPVAGAFVYPVEAVGRHVRSDGRGHFELSVDAGEGARISGAADGFLPRSAQLPADRDSLTLALDPAVDLEGRVVDAAGGPVAGAEVLALPHGESRRNLSLLFSSPKRRALSDADGAFVLPRLGRDVAYSVTARHRGFAPRQTIVRDLARAAPLRLVLDSGTRLTGRVVAPDGLGVAGAALLLEREEEGVVARFLRNDPRRPRPLRFETVTDGDGELSFADVPVGRFRLQIEAVGFATETLPPFEIEPGMRAHDLGVVTLEPGVALDGRVVDPDGLPLAGAEVSIEAPDPGPFSLSHGSQPAVLSGADGSFAFADRRRGEVLDLSVELAGYATRTVPGVEVALDEGLDIVLQPAVTLRGRVVDDTGAPVAGATVGVSPEGGGASYGGRVFTWPTASDDTDDLGRFAVVDVEPGTVRVFAEARGFLPTEIGDVELALDAELEELEIELRPGASVAGRVIAPDGVPLSDAWVSLDRPGRYSRHARAVTDGDGLYRLGGVEQGRQLVMVRHEDGLQAAREIEVEPGENRLDFYLEAGVEVAGTVIGAEGKPVVDAVVSLSAPGGVLFGGGATASSDAAGAFVIEHVPPGVYRLSAEHPAFAPTSPEEPLEVGEAPILGLRIRLAAGAELTGSLLGVAAEDLVAMEVTAVQPAGRVYREGRVDSDATYRVSRLGPGAWTVYAHSATGRQTSEVVEIAAGESRVVLDLEFEEGLVLSGRLSRRGEPVAGAWVTVSGSETAASASGRSDYDGRFRLAGLEAGHYDLRIHDAGGGVHSRDIELRRDDDILIELASAAVAGRVTEDRGDPLAGASVILESVVGEGEPPVRVPKAALTDAAGRFRISDVSPGSYRVRAAKRGFAAALAAIEVGERDVDEVDFALEEVEGLGMTVLLPSGAPATQITYAILAPTGAVALSGREAASSEGRVRLTTVPDGDWTLMLESPGMAVQKVRTRAPRDDLTVRLERAATLSVVVEELVRDASAVATLRLTAADGLPFASLDWSGGTIDRWRLAAGRVDLDAVPAGRWLVEVATTDGREWSRSVVLEAGPNPEVVFD